MTTPENTATRDPFTHLAGSMVEGSTGYITGMEAEGQQQFVNSDVLPVNSTTDDQWLIDHGFELGDPVDGDPLFRHVTLPEGWTRKGTSHSMHSHILDDRGLPRIGVFYKAAFYDRRAHWHPMNPGRQIASEYTYGEVDAIPWDVLTDDEREAAVVFLRSYAPGGDMESWADPPQRDRAVGELERVGVPQVASDR